jgi:hypothetical protein
LHKFFRMINGVDAQKVIYFRIKTDLFHSDSKHKSTVLPNREQLLFWSRQHRQFPGHFPVGCNTGYPKHFFETRIFSKVWVVKYVCSDCPERKSTLTNPKCDQRKNVVPITAGRMSDILLIKPKEVPESFEKTYIATGIIINKGIHI